LSLRTSVSSDTTWVAIADHIGLPIFFFAWLGWKIVKKTKMVPLAEIDFVTGMRELDEQQAEDDERFKPDTRWKKFVSVLF
jgi:amino acid transporter